MSESNGRVPAADPPEEGSSTPVFSPRTWIGYVVPMVAFMALTVLEGQATGLGYPILYTLKAVVVTVTLIMSRRVWKEIQFDRKMLLTGIVVGALGYIEWIYVDRYTPHFKFLGSRTGFNPTHEIPVAAARYLFLTIRFYGLVVMVPLMEEIFWRSFLLRWITDPEFSRVKLGDYSLSAFFAVAGVFAAAHPEWLAAAIYAMAMGLLLKKTRSLFACIVAHGVTNLLLGIYVMQTHSWTLW